MWCLILKNEPGCFCLLCLLEWFLDPVWRMWLGLYLCMGSPSMILSDTKILYKIMHVLTCLLTSPIESPLIGHTFHLSVCCNMPSTCLISILADSGHKAVQFLEAFSSIKSTTPELSSKDAIYHLWKILLQWCHLISCEKSHQWQNIQNIYVIQWTRKATQMAITQSFQNNCWLFHFPL